MLKISVNCREKIPLEMQDDCDEIYPAVLVNILRGQQAYNSIDDLNTPFQTKIYGPPPPDQNGK